MSVLYTLWVALCLLITVVWLTRHIDLARARRRVDALGPNSFDGPPEPAPVCSVIVAAKDEEDVIEQCVRSLLVQDYPNLELIFVNDRSTDRTGRILESLRSTAPDRLRVVNVDELPDGWTGKPNAMCNGVRIATGEFLLFSDADCEQISKRTVSMAMRYAVENGIDFLSILPIVEPACLAEAIIQPVCTGVLMIWHKPEKVNDPNRTTAYANGAFMLIRRDAYERIGGHQAVRNVICEDMQMARNAKAAGVTLRVVQNRDLYRSRMYVDFAETWRGWTRILHGSLQYPGRIVLAILLLKTFSIFPWVSLAASLCGWLIAGGPTAWPWTYLTFASAAAVIAQQSVTARLYPLLRAPARRSLTYIIGSFFCLAILANALLKSIGYGSTTWRGTTYRGGPPGGGTPAAKEDAPVHAR